MKPKTIRLSAITGILKLKICTWLAGLLMLISSGFVQAWIYFPIPTIPTIPPELYVAPSAPASISAPSTVTHPTAGSWTVSWASSNYITSYKLTETYFNSTGQQQGSPITISPGSALSFAVSGKTLSGTYKYRVQACNLGGCSAYTDFKSVNLMVGVASTITLSTTYTIDGNYTVSWPSKAHLLSATLQQRASGGAYQNVRDAKAHSNLQYTTKATGDYEYRLYYCTKPVILVMFGTIPSLCNYELPKSVEVRRAPAPLAAPNVSPTSKSLHVRTFNINWATGTENPTRYELWRSDTAYGAASTNIWNQQYSLGQNERSKSQNLGNGTYRYKVRACNGICGPWSSVRTVSVLDKPSAVPTPSITNKAGNHDSTFNVTWGAATGVVSSYQLYRRSAPYGTSTWSSPTAVTSSQSLDDGHYKYFVRATNNAGFADSAELSTTVLKLPETPISISAPADTDGRFNLSIAYGAGRVTNYKLQHSVDSGVSWVNKEAANGKPSTVSITRPAYDSSGNPQENYLFRIAACNESGCSAYSSASNNVHVNPPGTPENIHLTNLSHPDLDADTDGSFTVNWSALVAENTNTLVNGVVYSIEEQISPSSTWVLLASNIADTSYPLTRNQGTYAYRIKACIPAVGCGDTTNQVEVTVAYNPGIPGAISGPDLVNQNSFSLGWTSASGTVTRYELEQRSVNETNGQLIQDTLAVNSAITGIASGHYYYKVRACNGPLCGAYTEEKLTKVLVPAPFSDNPLDSVSAYSLPTGDNNVGAIGGSHEVGADGSASYAIKIPAAAGRGGLSHELSLAYNSNSGNGDLGVGWSISGLPAIHRCGTNYALDGYVDGVDFDNNDQLCLDGQRLLAVSGNHGASGTTYRTLQESYVDVVSLNGEGSLASTDGTSTADAFKVRTRNGRTLFFGGTPNSRLSRVLTAYECASYSTLPSIGTICTSFNTATSKSTYRWMLTRIEDRQGNSVHYHYENNDATGEQRIDEVTYNDGLHRIDFSWEPRPDKSQAYFAGGLLSMTQRLKSVTSYSDSTSLRSLNIGYSNNGATGDSKITNIEECAQNNCLNPTTFEWELGVAGYTLETSGISNYTYNEARAPWVIDINGDGFDDIITPTYNTWRVALGGTNILSDWHDTGVYITDDARKYALTLRYNNDVRDDLLVPSGSNWYVLKASSSNQIGFDAIQNTGIPSTGYDQQPKIVDINGDGRGDLVYRGGNGNWYYRLMTDNGFGGAVNTGAETHGDEARANTFTLDYNSDGLQDLLVPHGSYYKAYLSTGSGFQVTLTNLLTNGYKEGARTVDLNGDGLSDIMFRNTSGAIQYVINQGNGFSPRISAAGVTATKEQWRVAKVLDYDSDGRSDIWVKDLLISMADGVVTSKQSSAYLPGAVLYPSQQHVVTLDFNGDALDDIVSLNSGQVLQYNHQGERPDYLTAITNGMGVTTRFKYLSLQHGSDLDPSPNPGFYAKDGESSYPLLAESSAAYVVSELTQSDGLGGEHSNSYRYRGLRTHIGGYGSLGFAQIITQNNSNNISTEVNYSQDYVNNLQGAAESIKTIAPNGSVLSLTVNDWSRRLTVPSANGIHAKRYRIHLDKTTVTKRDLNGSFLSHEVNDYSYDSYDNIATLTSKVYADDNAATLLRTSITTNTWQNDDSEWLIGLLQTAVVDVTDHSQNAPVHTRKSAFEYDSTTGRKLVEKILDPDTDTPLHITRYGPGDDVDSFGNIRSISTEGPDFSNRSELMYYDINYGINLVETINAGGLSTVFEYYSPSDFSAGAYPGKIKLSTSANGLKTYTTYDSFGRTSTVTTAYGTAAAVTSYTVYSWCDSGCRSNAQYRLTTYTDGGTPVETELDKLGRTLRKRTLAMDGRSLLVDYNYNNLGHNIAVSEPYFEGGSPLWTDIEYDILDRVAASTDPSGRRDTIAYNGLSTISKVDVYGKNHHKTERRDSLSNLLSVTDNSGNSISYDYDSAGRQTAVKAPGVAAITIAYDSLGRKSQMNDPDKGLWRYTYNGLGQLISQTNAKGDTSCMAYDLLGRIVKRIDQYSGQLPATLGENAAANQQCAGSGGDTSQWVYNSNGNGIGQLASVSSPNYAENYQYDTLGRPAAVTTTVNGDSYTIDTSYDAYSRPQTISYPASSGNYARLVVAPRYNALGYNTGSYSPDGSILYSRPEQIDALGNITHNYMGNGVHTHRQYDLATGHLESIHSHHITDLITGSTGIQDIDVEFDLLGNLLERSDATTGFSERYQYDNLNRLTDAWSDFGNGEQHTEVVYDILGNIKQKSLVGNYTYGGSCNGVTAGPHAVTGITPISGQSSKTATYCYDANGNMTSGDGRSLSYTSFDKPDSITKGSNTTHMRYGAGRQLIWRNDITATSESETTLIGGVYERVVHTDGSKIGLVEERHYVGPAIVTYSHDVNGNTNVHPEEQRTRYTHTDHIGSIVAITDEVGLIEQRMSFDAWGKRRAATLLDIDTLLNNDPYNFSANPLDVNSPFTDKGFTGHQQLDGVGIIHMGGRIYDAELGRFAQADPFVQDRTNLQGLNRYSYVENNPLSYTDPSGYFLKKLYKKIKKHLSNLNNLRKEFRKKTLQAIGRVKFLSTVISVVLNFIPGCQFWCAAIFQAAMTNANGGSFGDILKGAAIGAITNQIGLGIGNAIGDSVGAAMTSAALKTSLKSFASMAAGQAVASGIASKAQGGKFIDGVKNSLLSSALTGAIKYTNGDFKKATVDPAPGDKGPGDVAGCQPINFATGEKSFIVKDYQAKGASRLKFERYYSSDADEVTGLGIGWRHNFDKKLVFVGGHEKPVEVKAVREQSGLLHFMYVLGEGYTPEADSFSRLKKTDEGWQLTLEDNSVEWYNSEGELVAIDYLGGYQQFVHYGLVTLNSGDTVRRLIKVEDSFGQEIELNYNEQGEIYGLFANKQFVTGYSYGQHHNLVRVSYPSDSQGNSSLTYSYADDRFPNAITSIWNETGHQIHEIAYDQQGRAIRSKVDGSGYDVAFLDTNNTRVTYSLGRQHTFIFDKHERLQAVEGDASANCLAANQGYQYDGNGQLVSKVDWNDAETRFEYNERGLETKRIEASGTELERVITTQWHEEFRLPVSITEPHRRIEFAYNASGSLVKRTELDTLSKRSWLQQLVNSYPSRSWTYQYDQRQLLVKIDGPRTDLKDITLYHYNDHGQRVGITNALGHTAETLAFNVDGLPTQVRDANGVITNLEYNRRGWLTSKTLQGPAGDETTRYQYTGRSSYNGGGKGVIAEGLVDAIIAPDGSKVSYQYDAGGRVILMSNADDEQIHYSYDAAGNPVKETIYSASGEVVRQQGKVFDELSRLLSIVGQDGVRSDYRYDKAGNRIAAIDGLGNESRFAFDALNRLISTTDALNGEVKQYYDAQDQLIAVADQRGLVTEYHYNGFGDKIAQISPDTGETLYGYDNAGNLIVKRNAEESISKFSYDALNRLTAIHYPAANDQDIHYQYDQVAGSDFAIGRLAQVSDASGQTMYSYNHRGQVVSKQYQTGIQSYRIENNYGPSGRLVATRYPSGRVVRYQHQQSALTAITTSAEPLLSPQTVVANIQSQPFGPLSAMQYGNDTALHIERDSNARIAQLQLTNASNDAIYNKAYRYDLASNIVAIDDQLNEEKNERFSYDPVHRLTSAEGHYGNIDYGFDAVGNRTYRLINAHEENTPQEGSEIVEHYRYDASSNRLLAVTSNKDKRQLNYDATGNIITDQRQDTNRALLYGATNRLQAVTGDDFGVEYQYNAKGQRVIKRVTQFSGHVEETHFHYDHNDQLMAETRENGSAIREYIYMGTRRIAMVDYQGDWAEQGQLLFIHNDHLGTAKMMTDKEGTAVWSAESLPFGERSVASISGLENPLRFPGQYGDGETGYSYNYFRDYDPSLGRYIQSDPIGLAGGVNTFGYVLGNPLMFVDPFGLHHQFERRDPSVTRANSPLTADYRATANQLVGPALTVSAFITGGPITATAATIHTSYDLLYGSDSNYAGGASMVGDTLGKVCTEENRVIFSSKSIERGDK